MENQNAQIGNQTPASQVVSTHSNSQLPLILGGIILLMLVGGGAYYLGTRNTNSYVPPISNAPTITPHTTIAPSINKPSPTITQPIVITWKDASFQIQKGSTMAGNENIKVTLKIPSDWTLQTVDKPGSQNDMIKNCADYLIVSSDKVTTLTLSPICTGWSATYKAWPADAVIVKDEGKVGNDNHSESLIRYSGSTMNNFIYSEGFKDENQIQDTAMLYYGNNFIPTKISVTATNGTPDTKIIDQIVSSIKTEI